ncbi:hypothetical protein [Streptomyces sp. NPDC001933]|uniref:hypothetical protein n=1 Tax=Streptomyces sp. NPDC001933 TaxID=3364626 RepID=UPI0036A03CB5
MSTCTNNTLTGTNNVGTSIQAGAIHGGVYFHYSPPELPLPRQLPPLPAAWVDREADLALLHDRSDSPPNFGSRLIVLSGQDGIGATTLASRLLHEQQASFRGGAFYINLRGYAPEGPLPVGRALGHLLRSVQPGKLPMDIEERAAWWRSATASREPTCLLIDNASRAADVRAFLPGGNGHLVLVTSRHPLSELAGEGAFLHSVGPLPPDAARTYLTERVGADRLQAEPEATELLIRLAAGYPAALVLTVAQVMLHPRRPLSTTVQALINSRRTTPCPPALNFPGATMTAHHDAAYGGLPTDVALAYRHLSLLPVPDFDTSLTAAVCAATPQAATTTLRSLGDAHLLEDIGDREQRGTVYRFGSAALHMRARDIACEDGDAIQRLLRALGWALAATASADALITPSHSRTLNLDPADLPHTPGHPVHHTDPVSALSWLKDQAENLLALVRAAHRAGHHAYVWRIVYSMWPWWRSESRHAEWIELHTLALKSLRHDPDRTALAELHLLNTFGLAQRDTGSPQALKTFHRVRSMALQAKDPGAEAQALHDLGATHLQMGDVSQAAPFLVQARRAREEHGYRRGVALTDILLGQVALILGHISQALTRFTDARTALLAEADTHDAAQALAWQGRALTQAGNIPAAESALDTARQELITAQAPRLAAQTLEWLGAAAEADGRLEDARARYTQAISGYRLVSTADADRVRIHLAGVS